MPANEARKKTRKCQHRADQRRSQQLRPQPTAIHGSQKLDQSLSHLGPICLVDPASLRPLDRDPTARAELAPGALKDYGIWVQQPVRVDLIGQLLPYVQNTYFLVPRKYSAFQIQVPFFGGQN